MTELVVLTGAASGIGRAAAQAFAARGNTCLLLDRDEAGLAKAAGTLPGQHHVLACDLTDPASFGHIAATVAGLGRVQVVANNAGMSDTSGIPMAEQTMDQLDRLIALNLRAPAALIRALRPHLAPGARVVNISSGAGLRAIPFRGAYSPTKAGVIGLTHALAASDPGLSATALCPGYVRTELVESLISAGRLDPAQAVTRVPLARMASPAEMAEALVFLASPEAAPLNGQALSYDGGSSVFGGSISFNAAEAAAPVAMDTPTAFAVTGAYDLAALLPASGSYEAQVDAGALTAGNAFAAVHAAAVRFAKGGARPASLTLLLPPAPTDWIAAGDHAAAVMAIATLACEWGRSGLRINALELRGPVAPQALAGVLSWVGGARAQYLTGQVIPLGQVA